MFSGSYHGKKCPPPDLVHVLQRAWDAGLIRIIVRLNAAQSYLLCPILLFSLTSIDKLRVFNLGQQKDLLMLFKKFC
uniref:Uncharacterized protein n=1 Tax=Physcomitrium patens TaxID=3218 RepID=A0A7I3Z5A9_PHYPA